MIAATVEELTPIIGTRPACRALAASVATIYRRRRPPEPRTPKPRPTPARALSGRERERVLDVLHPERFVDVAPEET
jgi:putative transposase